MTPKQTSGRYLRLEIDYTDLMNVAKRSSFIGVEPVEVQPGWPPEKYLITFSCNGFAGINADGSPICSNHHQVSIYLSRDYPSVIPSLLWLTDIWHPNIDHKEPRHVCTNDVQTFWAQKPLSELVLGLGEMVQYKRYHAQLKPPFPQDLDVARWVREVAEPKGWVRSDKPLDPRPLLRQKGIRRRRKDAIEQDHVASQRIKMGIPNSVRPRITIGKARTDS